MLPFDDEPDSIDEIQEMVEITLNKAYELEQIDDDRYRQLSIDICQVHGDPHDHFYGIMQKIYDAVTEYKVETLQKRMINGAAKIEKETDPTKKQKYMELYDQLFDEYLKLTA